LDVDHGTEGHGHSHGNHKLENNLKDPLLPIEEQEKFNNLGDGDDEHEKLHYNNGVSLIKAIEQDNIYDELRAIKGKCTNQKNHMGFRQNSTGALHRIDGDVKPQIDKKKVKSEEDSDEDEEAFKTVVSSKGHFTSFLQVRNLSKYH